MNRKNLLYAFCVFASLILFAFFSTSQGVLLTPLVEHYGLTESSQGTPNAAMNIGCAIALLSSLFIMGRVEKPRLMLIAMAATIILVLLLFFKPSFPIFTLLYAAAGIAFGYIDTLASSSIADLFKGKQASRMMGLLHSMFGIAGILSPIILGALMRGGMAWKWVYFIVACIGALLYIYTLPVGSKWIKEVKGEKSDALKLSKDMLGRFFGNREIIILCFVALIYAFYFGGLQVWLDRFINVELHHPTLGNAALSLFWAGNTVSRLVVPFIKISPLRYLQISGIIGGLVLLVGILSGNAYVMAAAVLISSLFAGATIPMIMLTGCECFPENTLLCTAAILLGIYIGSSAGPAVIGQIESALSIRTGLVTTVVALILSSLIAWIARRKPISE